MTSVTDAVLQRKSVRAFSDKPISSDIVKSLLEIARHAPSSGNLQPWHLYAMSGDDLAAFKQKVRESLKNSPKGEGADYPIYPTDLKNPYNTRRVKCGEDMYATLDISRDNKAGRLKQFARNFAFFDAPVGLIIAVHKTMGVGQWADLGIFLQTFMLLATERGLATCPQACWTMMHQTIAAHLSLPDDMLVYCGVALGYADDSAPVNTLRTDRAELSEIADFRMD